MYVTTLISDDKNYFLNLKNLQRLKLIKKLEDWNYRN